MNRVLKSYVSSEDGASASEFALMLLILGGCVATALHALGRG
jgi:Flp pilus assembly pilin Flp